MLFQIKSYFKFLWKSTNQHGVHSPFVFNLVTQCFYDRKPKPDYETLRKYRAALFHDHHTIEVTDFGAGSKVFKSDTRAVSKIAKTAGITAERAELLFRLTRYFKPASILEIGTSVGLASSAMTLGSPEAKITTLEGCMATAGIANAQFQNFNFQHITPVVTEFGKFLKNDKTATYDLVYFDGNHQKEATLQYFELLLSTINNDTVWIFDDIHWSPEMEKAWEMIKNNPVVTVTIDTFQWGFVFFRKEQEKEHFVIRV